VQEPLKIYYYSFRGDGMGRERTSLKNLLEEFFAITTLLSAEEQQQHPSSSSSSSILRGTVDRRLSLCNLLEH
jgi:hypothetical protein